MNKIFLLILSFVSLNISAQLNQSWINNFCCFDSVAPHSFSILLGKDFNHDTLVMSFYEDQFLNFKKIDAISGNDIQLVTNLSDTIETPVYFGGGTTFIGSHLITSALKYNSQTGTAKLFLNSVDINFNQEWNTDYQTASGKISKPLSDISGNNFYTSIISDSVKVFKNTINGNTTWIYSNAIGNTNHDIPPLLFRNSLDEIILFTRENDGTGFNPAIHLIKINASNGAILIDSIFSNTFGNYHLAFQKNDLLKIAFIKNPTHEISFIDIDLINLNFVHFFNTSIVDFSSITKFTVDTITNNLYLKTNNKLYGFTNSDILIFNSSVTPSASDIYDMGNITFDQHNNLLLAYSFYNNLNNPVNVDLKIIRVDKNNGNVIESIDYNDSRNTDENFLDNYFINNKYYVIFANNFDNASILQEETQLGIIKYDDHTLGVSMINFSESINFFPNPFHSTINCDVNDLPDDINYSIIDVDGRTIVNGKLNNGIISGLEKLEAGMYLIRIISDDKFVFSNLLIKN